MYIDAHSHCPSPGPDVFTLMSCSPGDFPAEMPSFTRISCGVHPWDTMDAAAVESSLRQLEFLAVSARIAAVGECGLDRLRGAPLAVQTEIFRRQLALAERCALPVVIHCVKAFSELAALRREYPRTRWLIHGYGGKGDIPAGALVSVGPAVLRRPQAGTLLKLLPPDRFLLETDDSGADITAVYCQAAMLLGCDPVLLARRLEENFNAGFGVVPGVFD